MNEKLKERVKKLLIEQPQTRDNDNLLIAQIWLDEGVPSESVVFLVKYSKGGFTSKVLSFCQLVFFYTKI